MNQMWKNLNERKTKEGQEKKKMRKKERKKKMSKDNKAHHKVLHHLLLLLLLRKRAHLLLLLLLLLHKKAHLLLPLLLLQLRFLARVQENAASTLYLSEGLRYHLPELQKGRKHHIQHAVSLSRLNPHHHNHHQHHPSQMIQTLSLSYGWKKREKGFGKKVSER